MMSLVRKLCQRASPFKIQKRFSTRESIHRYVEPEKFKKHMLAASEPYVKRKYVLQSDSCVGLKVKEHELEPLQRIYAEELSAAVAKSDFVLFIQHNYTPYQSERVYINTITKTGGTFYSHRNVVYKTVFKDLDNLFVTRNSLILGQLDKLASCVNVLKKMPQFLLLAGCIHNELFTNQQLDKISLSTDLDLCRATLVSILETPAIDLHHNLKQYVHMNSGTSAGEGEESLEPQ